MLAREREGEEAEGGEVGDGLVEIQDEVGEVDGVVEEGELELVVVGAEVVCDGARVVELVVGVFAEADTEVLDTRVDSAMSATMSSSAESIAPADVAHEAQSHDSLRR